jgi:hypothetical protein
LTRERTGGLEGGDGRESFFFNLKHSRKTCFANRKQAFVRYSGLTQTLKHRIRHASTDLTFHALEPDLFDDLEKFRPKPCSLITMTHQEFRSGQKSWTFVR